ncbi:MAG: peptide deformylase [Acidobacteriota bacterium]
MAIRKIELYGSPVLREKSAPVTDITPEVQALLDDMVETMRHASGAGLAANQVGIAVRAMVVDLGAQGDKEQILYLLNPEIVEQSGEMHEEEGCLSIPKIYERVKRPARIRVKALDREGNSFEIEGTEFLCRALCHEIDHLDGILFVDRLSPLRRDIVKRKIKKLIRDGEWEDPYPQFDRRSRDA